MEKKREEVSDEFKWDLSTIYKTEEDLSLDYEKIRKKIEDIKKYEDNFLDSSSNLYEFFPFCCMVALFLLHLTF